MTYDSYTPDPYEIMYTQSPESRKLAFAPRINVRYVAVSTIEDMPLTHLERYDLTPRHGVRIVCFPASAHWFVAERSSREFLLWSWDDLNIR